MEDLNELRKIAEGGEWNSPWTFADGFKGGGGRVIGADGYPVPGCFNCGENYAVYEEVDARHIATFDPPTVLELIERAEAAEHALDFHSQRDRELKSTLSMIADRLDEHSYDELSSLLEDEPVDQWGETYKSRLEQAEQQVRRVREVASGWATLDRPFREAILRALDGDGRG